MKKRRFGFKSVIGILAIVFIAGIVLRSALAPKSPPLTIPVIRGEITQQVIVTGTTKPVKSFDLAFQKGGKISRVRADVGSLVTSGQILAQLDASELSAQLQQANANLITQEAKLDSLKIGTRPEDIQVAQTAVAKAQQDLANDYGNVISTLGDSYSKADDAVRNQTDQFFSNVNTDNPQLTFNVSDIQIQNDVISQRIAVGKEMSAWKDELLALSGEVNPSDAELDGGLSKAKTHLVIILTYLNRVVDVLNSSTSLSASTLSTYKTDVNTGRTEGNTALSNIGTLSQTIATQKIIVKQQQDALAVKLAGSSDQDIQGQAAQVAQAKAQVALVQAQIEQTVIRAPIAGIITKQNAKVGEIAAANTPIVSLISQGNFEIESNVPEVDIGKIALGNTVDITLDAFPGEHFTGKVTKIDPAETVVDGVVNFKMTVDFDVNDSRLKSGLTANLSVETERKSGVLILPQVAILETDAGSFVKVYENGTEVQRPVVVGIRDQKGNVEIVSGVSEGDQVLNVGLKSAQ